MESQQGTGCRKMLRSYSRISISSVLTQKTDVQLNSMMKLLNVLCKDFHCCFNQESQHTYKLQVEKLQKQPAM